MSARNIGPQLTDEAQHVVNLVAAEKIEDCR
jgi:hypothetical protein